MFKQLTIAQMAPVIVALLIGAAFGTWITSSSSTSPSVAASVANTHSEARPKAEEDATESRSASGQFAATSSSALSKSLAEILRQRNSRQRAKDLQEFAKTLPLGVIGDALKQLRRTPQNSARELAIRLLVARWSEGDPEAALQFAVENRDFDYIADDVFQQFAADNLQSALARAQSIPDPNLRYEALRGVLSYMADEDPVGALKLAATFGPFPNNEPLTQMIYRQWSEVDPQAAAAQAALDSNGEGWRSPVGQVLRNWASQDPVAALTWVNSVSDPSDQARDIGQIIRQWSRNDLNAAVNWVNTAPAGPIRDAAAAGLAYSVASTDPPTAVGWAMSIADQTQRENALQRLGREIMYRDPANGAAILQSAGVPANLIPPPPDPNQPRRWRGGM